MPPAGRRAALQRETPVGRTPNRGFFWFGRRRRQDMSPALPQQIDSPPVVTRFAPSPTGLLHLGHVRSALEGWRAARDSGGQFLLRLEDIDRTRCREEYAAAIIEDLAWLGLGWDGPIRRQSEHFGDYAAALRRLDSAGLLYPCFCT